MVQADLSPSLRAWVASLASTGLFEETSPGCLRLRSSQTALATALGYSPGSGALSRRLHRLEQAGVLVSRRPLTFQVAVVEQTAPSPDPFLSALLDRAIEARMEVLAIRVLEEMLVDQRDPRDSWAFVARSQRESARYAPGVGSSFSVVQTDAAISTPIRARSARPAGGSCRNAAQLRDILAPLLAECADRGLPGITNMPGLLTAVQGLDDDEVRLLASRVLEQLRLGAQLRSPVGLLASMACPATSPESF